MTTVLALTRGGWGVRDVSIPVPGDSSKVWRLATTTTIEACLFVIAQFSGYEQAMRTQGRGTTVTGPLGESLESVVHDARRCVETLKTA